MSCQIVAVPLIHPHTNADSSACSCGQQGAEADTGSDLQVGWGELVADNNIGCLHLQI